MGRAFLSIANRGWMHCNGHVNNPIGATEPMVYIVQREDAAMTTTSHNAQNGEFRQEGPSSSTHGRKAFVGGLIPARTVD